MDVVERASACFSPDSDVCSDWTIDVPEEEAIGFKNESCMALFVPWTPLSRAVCNGIIPDVCVLGMANRNVFDAAAAKDIGPINPGPGIGIIDEELSAETPKGVLAALASGEPRDICPGICVVGCSRCLAIASRSDAFIWCCLWSACRCASETFSSMGATRKGFGSSMSGTTGDEFPLELYQCDSSGSVDRDEPVRKAFIEASSEGCCRDPSV